MDINKKRKIMSKKLTKRQRYVLKWNGPYSMKNLKREYARCKAMMGHGTKDERVFATAYVCRFRGFFPESAEELYRRAGVL